MDVRIVEERSYSLNIETTSTSHDSFTAHVQRKHFLYFTDEKIFSVLMEICRTLGRSDMNMRDKLYQKDLFLSLCTYNNALSQCNIYVYNLFVVFDHN